MITRAAYVLTDGKRFLYGLESGVPVWTDNPSAAMGWQDPVIAGRLIRQVPTLQPLDRLTLKQLKFQCPAAKYPLAWEVVDEPEVQPEATRELQKIGNAVARHGARTGATRSRR